MAEASAVTIYTVGHSNTPALVLLEALAAHEIDLLVDVRLYPMSRRHPQFNRDALAATLAGQGIEYRHAGVLGGRRTPRADSINTALTSEGFRGFADYMATPDFERGLADVLALAAEKRVAIMCAEGDPKGCHRSLISDALVARGVPVRHIVKGALREHGLSPIARAEEDRVTYPGLL